MYVIFHFDFTVSICKFKKKLIFLFQLFKTIIINIYDLRYFLENWIQKNYYNCNQNNILSLALF